MRYALLLLAVGLQLGIVGQHPADSLAPAGSYATLGAYLKEGNFNFHVRSFSMATINRGDLLDYHTSAIGGGLGYYSPYFKGLHFGVSGFFTFQLYEQNIRIADPTTGNVNRYEILLYDMSNLDNISDFDRLEDFYVGYKRSNFRATFGRQRINTPLANEQDNRMRHNSFSGLTLNYNKGAWSASAAWYTHVTMRGTVRWYRMDESFGVYPFGRNPLGTPSNYTGNLDSKGLGIFGLHYQPGAQLHAQLWNYTSENIFNLSLAQVDGRILLNNNTLIYGVQSIYQHALNDGGNAELPRAYMDPATQGLALGTRLGIDMGGHQLSVNALRISTQGRFLFPREWGREQLYVSLPRERHEGNGDVWAFTAKYEGPLPKAHLRTMAGLGYVSNPSLDNFALNKYGVPSYIHVVGGLRKHFHNYLDGLEMELLIAHKTGIDSTPIPDSARINRVDMWNLNMVLNYRF